MRPSRNGDLINLHTIKNVLLVYALTAATLMPVSAQGQNPIATAHTEVGFLTGYGITHRDFGATRTQVQTWDAIVRAGFFLSDEIGKGEWYQGRHQFVAELPYHLAVDHDGRSMTGFYMLGHWRFTSHDKIAPYVFAGGGPMYVDLGLPSMGSRLCFSYQAGTGVQYFINSTTAVDFQYRYHHISNGDIADRNEPLNSSKILFGMAYYY